MLAAPQARTTMSARVPLGAAVALDNDLGHGGARLVGLELHDRALVSRVTFGCSSAGRTPSTSASDFPCTAHGKPSQFWQRTQALCGMFSSASRMPHGAWNGW